MDNRQLSAKEEIQAWNWRQKKCGSGYPKVLQHYFEQQIGRDYKLWLFLKSLEAKKGEENERAIPKQEQN